MEVLTMDLNLSAIKDVVEIPNCGLYAKTPEALHELLNHLREVGYRVDDCSIKEKDRRPARDIQEKEGWYLWFASLLDSVKQVAKCVSCGQYISIRHTLLHGDKCEKCGALLYSKNLDGIPMSIPIVGDHDDQIEVIMKVREYDEKNELLILYPEPLGVEATGFPSSERDAQSLVTDRSDVFRPVGRYQKKFLAMPFDIRNWPQAVYRYGSSRAYLNYTEHKLLGGKEYKTDFLFPTYSIYEAWHWMPISRPNRILHEKIFSAAGQVSSADFYHQDGRPAFHEVIYNRMRIFVEHFTTIPLAEWDQFMRSAPQSGPGLIRAMASFCQGVPIEQAMYREEPNIGNALIGMFKIGCGKRLTSDESRTMKQALSDPEIFENMVDIYKQI